MPLVRAKKDAQMQTALNRLGYYMPDPKIGMAHDLDANFTDALYAYQRKSTIMPDDIDIAPNSTTDRMLNQDLAALYIWRTVGDEKVRGSHATRNGQRFSWTTPPDGGHAGEDYNCRCWAEPLVAPYHPWIKWVEDRRDLREKFAPSLGVKDDLITPVPLDAINPTFSLFDFALPLGIGIKTVAGIAVTKATTKIAAKKLLLEAAKRDVEWIKNTPMAQFQSKFKHAKIFGINSNPTKQSLKAYKEAIEQHIRSPNTVIKKGTYHRKPATHYYNEKTGINVIRGENGDFVSGWELKGKQIEHLKKWEV